MSKWRQQAVEAPSTATFIRPSREDKLTPYHYPQPRAVNCATILVNNSNSLIVHFLFSLLGFTRLGRRALGKPCWQQRKILDSHLLCKYISTSCRNFNRF